MKRSSKKTDDIGHTCRNRRPDILPLMNEVHAGPEDYKQLAERCFELANELSSAPTVADAIRALAMDYLMRAAKLRRREPMKFRLGRRRTGRPNRRAG
jgi:hypothetical protein